MNKATITGIILIFLSMIILLFSRFEIDFGRCLNDAGDGKLYNGEPFYNYICYHNAKENDIVMTLCLNDRYGECAERWDYIIFKDTK